MWWSDGAIHELGGSLVDTRRTAARRPRPWDDGAWATPRRAEVTVAQVIAPRAAAVAAITARPTHTTT